MRLRKHHSDAGRLTGESGESRPQKGSGWGPFSGGQLTVIIVAIVAAIGFPVGAFAVSTSKVAVTDAKSGKTATVNSSGQLATSAKVSGSVTATGTVTAQPATSTILNPLGGFYFLNDCTGVAPNDVCTQLLAPPAGKAYVITSAHIATWQANAPGGTDRLGLFVSTNGSCTIDGPVSSLDEVFPQTLGETVLPYAPGWSVPAGSAFCVYDSDPNNLQAQVALSGYSVAANAVPSTASASKRQPKRKL